MIYLQLQKFGVKTHHYSARLHTILAGHSGYLFGCCLPCADVGDGSGDQREATADEAPPVRQ
jgi:hypothetical protein